MAQSGITLNLYLIDTAGNYQHADDAMSPANQKRTFDRALLDLGGQWSGVGDFMRTVESGQPVNKDDFYWLQVDSLGMKNKQIYRLMELPDQYHDFQYELYCPYGEIDPRTGAVREYSFNASRMRSVKYSW